MPHDSLFDDAVRYSQIASTKYLTKPSPKSKSPTRTMKTLRTIAACTLAAAGYVTSSLGQVQVAGNLQVSLDAVGQPVGPIGYLTNDAVAGGVFASVTNAGTGPQVIALGGNGTHGVLFDGNSLLA